MDSTEDSKSSDDSNVDYESIAARKHHLNCSDDKTATNFVGQTKAMFANDLIKSTRFISSIK